MLDSLRQRLSAARRSNPARWVRWQAIKAVHAVAPQAGNAVDVADAFYAAAEGPFVLGRRHQLVHGLLRPGESVLEVGCGRGEYVRYLRDEGRRVMGVDYSTVAIEGLRGQGLDVAVHDLLSPDPLPTGFDVVVCLEVLEHFRDPWRIYEKLWAAAGRRVIFSVPYRYRVPDWNHLYEFSYETIVEALSHHGVVGFMGGHPMYIIATQAKPGADG